MDYVRAFLVGGALCVIGQLLIDFTKLTPARILVIYVVSGTILTVLGLYQPLVEFAGCGATIPLTGFGYSLGKGVIEGIDKNGLLGVFSGGLAKTSAGIAAAVFFGFFVSLICKPKDKK
ncbi:MAG: stage V sporulation protein AE [Ruminococcaceae bacterium]|nr:stage V sporulation protein AE [Oscillospiraceae bacterium]